MLRLSLFTLLLISQASISGVISDNVQIDNNNNRDSVFAKIQTANPRYKIEIAYSYDGGKPISIHLEVKDRGTSDTAKGEMISFKSYHSGKVVNDPLFLGLRVAAKHIHSKNNNFMWLSMEFNKLTGAVSSPLNIVRVNIGAASRIKDSRKRMAYLRSLPLVDMPTPILSEESGVFYLPVKIGRDIVSYKKGKLSIKIRIREIK